MMPLLSDPISFANVDWNQVPERPGAYVIYEGDEAIYVGMAGRNGKGNLRKRLKDHRSGQTVNMFAQYLFLARVQFVPKKRITHPREAKAACHEYLTSRCSFRFVTTAGGSEARELERSFKADLQPTLNP